MSEDRSTGAGASSFGDESHASRQTTGVTLEPLGNGMQVDHDL